MADDKNPEFKYLNKERKELIKIMNDSSRLFRYAVNVLGYALVITILLTTKTGWETLKDPEFRRLLAYREGRIGFLEYSILQNPLYVPSDSEGSLEFVTASAGRWVGYDFKRESEFGENSIKRYEGKLISFILDEIKENKPLDYTPTTLFRFFDFSHLIHFETPSVDYLIENGLLETRTYREAFQKSGKYEEYARTLDLFEITEKPVYQITPKGNGLIFLSADGGEKVTEKKKAKKLVPAYQL